MHFLRSPPSAIVAGTSQIFQPSFALTNSGSITALNVPLTENFDGLASTGTAITWADNTTLPGVYSSRPTYNSRHRQFEHWRALQFRHRGHGAVTDRALGSVGSGATGTVYWGVRLTNNTGTTITSLQVSYTGEQWRNGRQQPTAQTVDFQYQIAPPATDHGINTPTTGWVDQNALDFTGPTFGATAGSAGWQCRGKSPGALVIDRHRQIPNGQEIWLRWADADHAGADHGLAIDDLSIVAMACRSIQRRRSPPPLQPPTRQRPDRFEHHRQLQRERQRHQRRVFAGVRHSPQPFTQTGNPSTSITLTPTCSAALRHIVHRDGQRSASHRRGRQRSGRCDGWRLRLLVHHGSVAGRRRASRQQHVADRWRDGSVRDVEHLDHLQRAGVGERAGVRAELRRPSDVCPERPAGHDGDTQPGRGSALRDDLHGDRVCQPDLGYRHQRRAGSSGI